MRKKTGYISYTIIAKNTLFLTIIEVIHIIMPFIALPYIIKTVGATNYGKIVFAQSICSYFAVLENFGLDFLGTKNISINRKNRNKCGVILSTILIAKSLMCLIGFIIFSILILLWRRTNTEPLVYFFSYVSCIADVFFIGWLYQGLEKMHFITFIRVSSLLVYVALLFIFLHRTEDYPLIPLLQSGSLIFTSLSIFFICQKREKITPYMPPLSEIFNYIKESFPFFLSRASNSFNNTIPTTLIGVTLGDYPVATYDFALKIIRTALIPVYMINQAVFPYNVRKKNLRFSTSIFSLTLCATVLGVLLLYFICPYIVHYLGGGELYNSVGIIRILLIYLIVTTFSIYLGTPTLVAWGFSKPFNNSVIFTTFILIFVYCFFCCCKVNSLYYYCYAAILGETIVVIYRSWAFLKYIYLPQKAKNV